MLTALQKNQNFIKMYVAWLVKLVLDPETKEALKDLNASMKAAMALSLARWRVDFGDWDVPESFTR